MCFQATVAALVCLTAACLGLTEGYLFTRPFQLKAKGSGFKTEENIISWFSK